MDTVPDAHRYLERIGVGPVTAPDLATLRAVHRAHVARVPYDNLSIMLGRPDPVDPVSCAARVASGGRLGYCFHQNAAFGWLLTRLGFAVSGRHGHVWSSPEHRLGSELNHLVLVVSGLPSDDNAGGHWWADVGLGEGFAEPLPLVRGEHVVDGWTYGIGAGFGAQAAGRPTGPAAWTYDHLPGGLLAGIVVTSRPHDQPAVELAHRALGHAIGAPFRRVLTAQRIDGPRQLTVRGCTHQVLTPAGRERRDLTSYDEWRGALADDLLLSSTDVTAEEWADLWDRTLVSHREWDAAGRP